MEKDAQGQWVKDPIYDEEHQEISEHVEKFAAVIKEKENAANIKAQQHFNNDIWQKTCVAGGIASQAEFNALKSTDPARANALMSDFHENMAHSFKAANPEQSAQGERPIKSAQAPMSIDPKLMPELKEKTQKGHLTDDQLMDLMEPL